MLKSLNTSSAKAFLDSLEESQNISQTNKVIIKRYIQNIMTDEPSKHTILYNIKIMAFLLDHVTTDLDKLTIDDIDDIKAAIANWQRNNGQPVAESTKKQYKIGIKRFLHYYADRYQDKEQLYNSLAKKIKLGKKAETKTKAILTDIEIKQMLLAATTLRDKAIVSTLAESGCRIGELVQCKIQDFKMYDSYGKLHFPAGKTGQRTVTLVNAAFAIDNLLRDHPQITDPEASLWLAQDGKEVRPLEYMGMYLLVKKLVKKAGITKNVHPHIFRHTAASRLAKEWTEPQLKQYLGWAAGSNMPATYIHLNEADMEEAVLEMNGLVEKVKESKGLKIGKCPRCRKLNSVDSPKCYNCGLPLTEEAREEDMEFANNALLEAFTAFLEKPETQAKMREYS